MDNLQVQLVWNREFDWSNYGKLHSDLEVAKEFAIDIRDSGDGERVKKVRVIDVETEEVLWRG